MNLIERMRRWWKPAEYEDEHPLTDEERRDRPAFTREEELGNLGGGLGPGVNPEDEFRQK